MLKHEQEQLNRLKQDALELKDPVAEQRRPMKLRDFLAERGVSLGRKTKQDKTLWEKYVERAQQWNVNNW